MASNNEIERLTVTLEADYSKLVSQTKEGVNQSEKELNKLADAPKKAQSSWEQLGGFLSGKFLAILTTIGAAVAAAFSVQAVVNFFSTIAGGMVETNKQFETFRVQFETLLGSQSEAQKRIDELAKFGVATPFELDEIVEGDRLLQTFGDTALATGENLRRVGDSAAAVNASFKEVSFWTGRLYSSMMAGRPFGEASARLQELGILSGETRTKLEDMQKAGAEGTEIWAAYSEMIDGKFSGAMDKLSKTLQGVMSNLADFQSMLLREGGEDLFEGVREDTIEFYEIISDPKAQEALIALSEAFGSVLNSLREAATTPFLESLREVDPEQLDSLSASIQDIGDAIDGISGLNVTSVSSLVDALDGMIQTTASLIQLADIIKELSLTVSGLRSLNQAGVEFGQIFGPLLNPVYGLADAVDNLNTNIKDLTGSSISEWLGGVEQEAMAAASSLDAMGFAADGVAKNMRGGTPEKPAEEPEDFGPAREKFEKLSQDFLDAQKEIQAEREEAEKDHGEKVASIVEDYQERITDLEEDTARKRADILKDSADELADLEREGAKRREEIAEDTAKALANLERDTADARADAIESANEDLAEVERESRDAVTEVQEEAREEERRETEDHQREMRQLQQQYLMDLTDAVASRDARAIVDLRRKYQAEKQEREEDFRVQQSRSREEARKRVEDARETEEKRKREIEEALEKQLEEIEENEARKREEIEASQREELEKLAETEAEKRAEIATSQEEQLAKLAEAEAQKRAEIEESLQEQLDKEQANYAERQALLDGALARKLEAVAQQLAQEKEITEAGAQAVLETLNSYYGAGGQIDQLMDAYRERQAAATAAMSNFDANLPGGGPGGGEFVPAGSGGGSGLPAFQEGGIVPGRPGQKRLIIAHAGELIIPPDQTSRFMQQQGDMMAQNFDNSPKVVELKVSGSAPPGIKGAEVEQMAGLIVQALNEAGIRARRK
jgi:hypothetical protein